MFGHSVSMSGDYAIVGAPLDDDAGSSSGSAYIFKREGSNWVQQAKLVASDAYAGVHFGWSVSINGDYATVGAFGGSRAYVFRRDGSNWVQEASLLPSDGGPGDHFGVSVCINGDYVVIGASGDSDVMQGCGSAYVFKREGSIWLEQAKLVGSDVGSYDWFGYSVSLYGDYALIGAPHIDWYPGGQPEQGSAYIFKREGSTWTEQARLVPMNGTEDDLFGNAVALNGEYAVVGAEWAHEGLWGHSIGSAYIFRREGSLWKEFAELIPSDGSKCTDEWTLVWLRGSRQWC